MRPCVMARLSRPARFLEEESRSSLKISLPCTRLVRSYIVGIVDPLGSEISSCSSDARGNHFFAASSNRSPSPFISYLLVFSVSRSCPPRAHSVRHSFFVCFLPADQVLLRTGPALSPSPRREVRSFPLLWTSLPLLHSPFSLRATVLPFCRT